MQQYAQNVSEFANCITMERAKFAKETPIQISTQ